MELGVPCSAPTRFAIGYSGSTFGVVSQVETLPAKCARSDFSRLKPDLGIPFLSGMAAGTNSLKPVDLRRPRIPKAAPVPNIPGPRGGLAYRPHPDDVPKNDNQRVRRAAVWDLSVEL